MPSDLTSGTPRRQHRSVPVLVLLIGLLLTVSIAERIRRSDDDARRAALEADAAQLGLIVQSLASSIEIDLTSSVGIALVTDGDPDVYRERTGDGSGDRALLSLDTGAGDRDGLGDRSRRGRGHDPVHPATPWPDPRSRPRSSALAENGSFGFVPLGDDERIGSLLIAAGASDDEHSYVEVRQFDLGPAGPMIASLIDGIDTFSVYIGDQADAATAVIASTTDLPLLGKVATAVVEVSDQSLLIEVQGSAGEVIPPWTVFVVGGLMSRSRSAACCSSPSAVATARSRPSPPPARRPRPGPDSRPTCSRRSGWRRWASWQAASPTTSTTCSPPSPRPSNWSPTTSRDPRTHEDLDEIRHAARRGATLTRRLLSFSRRDVEAREPLDLNRRHPGDGAPPAPQHLRGHPPRDRAERRRGSHPGRCR